MKHFVSIIISMMLIFTLVLGITEDAGAEQRVAQVTTGARGAALRNYPEGDKIGSVHQNICLDVLEQQDGWFYVYYKGQYGWVSSTVVTITRVETIAPNGNDSSFSTGWTNSQGTVITGRDTGSSTVQNRQYSSQDPWDMGVPYIGNTVFRENMMNMVVFWVQTQLKATGVWYQGYQWDVTGHLGDHTMSEIRSFMSSCGYHGQTGVVNQDVIDALVYYLGDRIQPVMIGGFYDSMRSITTGDSYGTMYSIISNLRDMVPHVTTGARWVQCVLKGLGYYSGLIDGMYGEKTDEAVRKFQRENGFQERDYVSLGVARSMLEQYYWRGNSLNSLP